jgi:hypothetical protein
LPCRPARARPVGIAISCLAERSVAIASDPGVSIHHLDDGLAAIPINGAADRIIPREWSRCTARATRPRAPTTPANPRVRRTRLG